MTDMIGNMSEADAKKILKRKKTKGKSDKDLELKKGKRGRIIDGQIYPAMAKGGRAGYKSGMRVCKLAKKGKGKAYGKNS